MKFDLALILEHFYIDGGVLYRKFAAGTIKRVKAVEGGRLVAMVGGRKYYGPDIAWAYHYELVPTCRIVTIDMDPHNLSKENLGAARRRRLLFRLTKTPRGYTHPLTTEPFKSAEEAQDDWVMKARIYYQSDLKFVLRQQTDAMAALPVSLALEKVLTPAAGTRGPKKSGPRPPQPQNIIGRKWFWYREQWVSLPLACHPSDDWRVRAAAVLKDPQVRFVYDPKSDKTLPVWSRAVA